MRPRGNRVTRRGYREIFLAKLTDLSDGGQTLIGNKTLRDSLGWDEDRYKRIKAQLVDENAVIVGRGQGGSIGLADFPDAKGLTVFISYSHADEALKNELVKHLEPLRRLRLIDAWHDRKLKAGDDWEKTISQQLENASIILLLVSIDFINSSYCYDIELDRALERHGKKEAVVIPVILRNCLWQHTPFAKIQALPKDGKAVRTWVDQDEALMNIADGVRQAAEDLRTKR
jgi:hypothetical protein